MEFQNLLVEHSPGIAKITINREKVMNALDADTLRELTDAVERLGDDRDVRVLVLTGAGDKAFVAGADIKGMQTLSPDEASQFAAIGHRLGDVLAEIPKIAIAAVNGFALGGGCELALCCDFIYASDKARFGQPEVNLGVIPGFGGTTRLPRRIGLARAIEMVTTGQMIGAEEALRIGLVNKVVPHAELWREVKATAELIAAKGPVAVGYAKRSLRASLELHLEEQNKLEIELFGSCFATQDQKEGMKAFLEKRAAAFTGT